MVRIPHFAQAAGLDLTDAFTRDVQYRADFVQRVLTFPLQAHSVDEDLPIEF